MEEGDNDDWTVGRCGAWPPRGCIPPGPEPPLLELLLLWLPLLLLQPDRLIRPSGAPGPWPAAWKGRFCC